MKRNLIGPLYSPVKKIDAVLYKAMHFNDIFDYHSHICEKNNITGTCLLLTVSLVVPHAGLIYIYPKLLSDYSIIMIAEFELHISIYLSIYI